MAVAASDESPRAAETTLSSVFCVPGFARREAALWREGAALARVLRGRAQHRARPRPLGPHVVMYHARADVEDIESPEGALPPALALEGAVLSSAILGSAVLGSRCGHVALVVAPAAHEDGAQDDDDGACDDGVSLEAEVALALLAERRRQLRELDRQREGDGTAKA
eukprot:6175288-Pleurochrysis_carterae.AAC.7